MDKTRTSKNIYRDEVNRRDVSECDGWVCVLEVIGSPSRFRLTTPCSWQGYSLLSRTTVRRTPCGGSGIVGKRDPGISPSQRVISNQMMKKWEPWETNMRKSNNSRMIQQLALHTQQIIKATSTQDLDPRPLVNIDHPSVLPFEMYAIEPGEPPSRSPTWKPLGFLSHIKCRTKSDRFPLSLWEVWFCSTLGVPIPALIGPFQQCACNNFHPDSFGDHLQTCKVKSVVSQVHDWVVYRLGDIFGSVGQRVKIHKITPAAGKKLWGPV
jgi:hypothetical protein